MSPIAKLRRALSKTVFLTKTFISDSNYDLSDAGRMRNWYQQDRGEMKRFRCKGKLVRNLNLATRYASEIGDSNLISLISTILWLNGEIIERCKCFPKASAWAGESFLRQHDDCIAEARKLIRVIKRGVLK